jgi:hypothetical protein
MKHLIETLKDKWIEQLENECAMTNFIIAYNQYQDDECDSVDYLFSIEDKNDLIICINGGLTANEIGNLAKRAEYSNYTPFFLFGCNHDVPSLCTKLEVRHILMNYAKEVIEFLLTYPHYVSSNVYQDLIGKYIYHEIAKLNS